MILFFIKSQIGIITIGQVSEKSAELAEAFACNMCSSMIKKKKQLKMHGS
jgi:hypothetical protein